MKGKSMDRQRSGLLLTSIALMIDACVLPLLPHEQPIMNGAHAVIGFLLGLGVAMILAGLRARRRAVRRQG
jgi:uncharacterized membrane protein